jgi:hypothetical protein
LRQELETREERGAGIRRAAAAPVLVRQHGSIAGTFLLVRVCLSADASLAVFPRMRRWRASA